MSMEIQYLNNTDFIITLSQSFYIHFIFKLVLSALWAEMIMVMLLAAIVAAAVVAADDDDNDDDHWCLG